ncbi:MAG: TonB-dependent receptor [Bacteroidota bacterium]
MRKIVTLLTVAILFSAFSYGQRNGKVIGKMVDASNGEPLYFANVTLDGTSQGTVTDEDGHFELLNLAPGDYILKMLYVGYHTKEVPVSVSAGETVDLGTQELQFESILGEEVVVTGQLRGQASAINQQVKSNRIMNAVSKEKIQEVPDANAAESLSRLPGITLSRSGGEGTTVAIRGVSSRFNSVTVNGQSIPGGDANNRSVNLSMVSADLLDGIEVYKAITPDMDADAIGGSVNLVTRTADEGWHGRAQIESGYHSLINGIGTYRGSFNLGNRFFDNKLGVLAGANYYRANRNTDWFDGDYELTGDGTGYRGNNAIFRNQIEMRDRYGFSATIDYQFESGEMVLDHVYSQTTRDVVTRGKRARPTVSTLDMELSVWENTLNLNSTNLRGEFDLFQSMELTFNLGRSVTTNESPDGAGATAEMEAGLTPEANDTQPLDIFRYLQPYYGLDRFTGGNGAHRSYNYLEDENYNGQVDLKMPFYLGSWFSGNLKFGGKVKQKQRDRTVENYEIFDWVAYDYAFRSEFPEYAERRTSTGAYPMALFIDEDYTGYDSPFADHNDIPFVFDPDKITEIDDRMKQIDSLFRRNVNDHFQEYNALERITAGYVMAEINIGQRITLIPGFRYENTYLDFAGSTGTQRNNEPFRITKRDTSGVSSIGEFLPMIHLKYEFIDGFALRLAATRTLSRPNYLNLSPFTQRTLANQKIVRFGSVDLKMPTAWNYDANLSWFSKYGLISVGAFYKEIYDIDINVRFHDWSGSDDPEAEDYNPYRGWIVNSPINSEETTTILGGELEVQTNFRFLPKPFDGLVLSGNFTLMESETAYPYFFTSYPPPDYQPVREDSVRINSTQGQADFIANVTLGYEKGGFSGRISMNYQGPRLATSANSRFQDEYNDEYMRFDAALSYKINANWQILANLVNLSNETERNYIYTQDQPSRIEQYGRRYTLGVRYRF